MSAAKSSTDIASEFEKMASTCYALGSAVAGINRLGIFTNLLKALQPAKELRWDAPPDGQSPTVAVRFQTPEEAAAFMQALAALWRPGADAEDAPPTSGTPPE